MSQGKKENQCRTDQYGVIEPSLSQPRAYNTGVGSLSDGAGKDPVQPNNRGDQGRGA